MNVKHPLTIVTIIYLLFAYSPNLNIETTDEQTTKS